MVDTEFLRWLIHNKELKEKSARDVLSRCRRIERVVGIDLDDAVESDDTFIALLFLLKEKVSDFSSETAISRNVYAPLRRAARLYSEYRIGFAKPIRHKFLASRQVRDENK